MSEGKWTDKLIIEALEPIVNKGASLDFIADKEYAVRALTRAFHGVLRNEGYNIFMDDILNYVETKEHSQNVY